MLTHWSQLVPNMSADIRGHQATQPNRPLLRITIISAHLQYRRERKKKKKQKKKKKKRGGGGYVCAGGGGATQHTKEKHNYLKEPLVFVVVVVF